MESSLDSIRINSNLAGQAKAKASFECALSYISLLGGSTATAATAAAAATITAIATIIVSTITEALALYNS